MTSHITLTSEDSAVGVVTTPRDEQPRNRGSILDGGEKRHFTFPEYLLVDPIWGQLAPGALPQGIQQPGSEGDHYLHPLPGLRMIGTTHPFH